MPRPATFPPSPSKVSVCSSNGTAHTGMSSTDSKSTATPNQTPSSTSALQSHRQDHDGWNGCSRNDAEAPYSHDAATFVLSLNTNDVLCGRGSGPNDHSGNIKFRNLVMSRKFEYLSTNNRQTKARIAHEIVSFVRNSLDPPGRFLRKVEATAVKTAGLPRGMDVWVEVDEETALEKAKQALRQNRGEKSSADDGVNLDTCAEAIGVRYPQSLPPNPTSHQSEQVARRDGTGSPETSRSDSLPSMQIQTVTTPPSIATTSAFSCNTSDCGQHMSPDIFATLSSGRDQLNETKGLLHSVGALKEPLQHFSSESYSHLQQAYQSLHSQAYADAFEQHMQRQQLQHQRVQQQVHQQQLEHHLYQQQHQLQQLHVLQHQHVQHLLARDAVDRFIQCHPRESLNAENIAALRAMQSEPLPQSEQQLSTRKQHLPQHRLSSQPLRTDERISLTVADLETARLNSVRQNSTQLKEENNRETEGQNDVVGSKRAADSLPRTSSSIPTVGSSSTFDTGALGDSSFSYTSMNMVSMPGEENNLEASLPSRSSVYQQLPTQSQNQYLSHFTRDSISETLRPRNENSSSFLSNSSQSKFRSDSTISSSPSMVVVSAQLESPQEAVKCVWYHRKSSASSAKSSFLSDMSMSLSELSKDLPALKNTAEGQDATAIMEEDSADLGAENSAGGSFLSRSHETAKFGASAPFDAPFVSKAARRSGFNGGSDGCVALAVAAAALDSSSDDNYLNNGPGHMARNSPAHNPIPRLLAVMENDPDELNSLGSSSMDILRTAMGSIGSSTSKFSVMNGIFSEANSAKK